MEVSLFQLCMKEPVFNKLRTDLQLGYSVFCSHNLFHGIIGFSVTVEMQANKFRLMLIKSDIVFCFLCLPVHFAVQFTVWAYGS